MATAQQAQQARRDRPAQSATARKPHGHSQPSYGKQTGLWARIEDRSWRAYMWLDGTIPLSMLEPWEKIGLLVVFLLISALFWWSVLFHLPRHLGYMINKGSYYLFGTSHSSSSNSLKAALAGAQTHLASSASAAAAGRVEL